MADDDLDLFSAFEEAPPRLAGPVPNSTSAMHIVKPVAADSAASAEPGAKRRALLAGTGLDSAAGAAGGAAGGAAAGAAAGTAVDTDSGAAVTMVTGEPPKGSDEEDADAVLEKGAVDATRSTTEGMELQLALKPAKEYAFKLDPFQRQAIACLERGDSVLVSAHTSAGKTVVAEYAIAMALRDHQRVIYTSPIKALSNQKYRDLYEEFSDVGLMTGDVTINPNASCLVMTTEILRSMLYRGSEVLREVAWVIYDEIHYMRDKERGVVWEESIILLPHKVRFVFLSATIPNAKEFAEWVAKIHHQTCHVVYTGYRPTPLQHYFFPAGGDGLYLVVDDRGRFRQDNFDSAMSKLAVVSSTLDMQMQEAEQGKKRRRKQKGPSDLFRVIKMIMERNYDPVIIFSFSKRECETYATQISQLDFTTDAEKGLINQVFTNAIDSLSDDDKALPQVDTILPLLKKGIGIHHGGLLPILKEVIEILFQESLIKCLFATETFAMGINMPAKTVIFTATRKFDGSEFRWVSAGEYIQMSGRAGRRGLDDRGTVIQMIDEKMDPAAAKDMLKGEADPLNSSFYLGYNMLLNLMRVEGADVEDLMSKSFYQFQNEKNAPTIKAAIEKCEHQVAAMEIPDEDVVAQFYALTQQAERTKQEMRAIVNQPAYVVRFLRPGRLVQVRDGAVDWGVGVVVNFRKTGTGNASEDEASRYLIDVLLWCAPSSGPRDKPTPAPPTSTAGEMKVVPIVLPLLEAVSSACVYLPKDLRPVEQRNSVWRSVQEVLARMEGKLPLLDPIKHMHVQDESFGKLVDKAAALEEQILASPLYNSPRKQELFALYQKKVDAEEQIRGLRKQLKQTQVLLMKDTLKKMKRVLRRLGYTDKDNVIQLKGRVAAEVNTADELLVTELIFNGVFKELSPAQSASLLSCLVYTEKGAEGEQTLPEQLAGPFRQLQAAARRVATVSQESKLEVDIEEYVASFHPDLMEVVFAWVNGAKFAEICKMTTMFEGTIIRVIRRLEELIRQLADAAKAIGDHALEAKFTEASTKMKRDIIFAASLYL